MPEFVTAQSLPWDLVLVVVVWLVGLWTAGAFVDPRVELFRQAATRRGLDVGLGIRAGARLPRERGIDWRQILDLKRVLLLAGREDSPGHYMGRAMALGLVTGVVLSGADAIPTVMGGALVAPLYLPALVGLLIVAVAYVDLFNRAAKRQVALDRAIADLPSLLAILVSARSMPLGDAVSFLAKLQVDPVLAHTLQPTYWRALIAATPETRSMLPKLKGQFSVSDLYQALGIASGSANMRELSRAARRILETGEPARTVCLELAKQLQQEQLHQSELAVTRAEKLSVLPMVGMLIAVFAVIGPAIFSSMMQAFTA